LAHALDVLLRLLHPMIPFVTEDVWQRLAKVAPQRGLASPGPAAESIMVAAWPAADTHRLDETIEAQFAQFQAVLAAVREIRSRQNIAPKTTLVFSLRCTAESAALLAPLAEYFQSMANARLGECGPQIEPPPVAASVVLPDAEVFVDLRGLIDVGAEIERNEKEAERIAGQIEAKQKKLANENFVFRAPAEVVQKERESLEQLQSRLAALQSQLNEWRKSG